MVSVSWRAASAALDAGAGVFATINTVYFVARLTGARGEPASRKAAVAVLLLISLAALVEAAVLLAAAPAGEDAPLLSSSQWFVVRFMACMASGGVCALVLRRISGGG